VPYNRHAPFIVKKPHEMGKNCIKYTVRQSIFLVQKYLDKVTARDIVGYSMFKAIRSY
jgi:hypothetical protein